MSETATPETTFFGKISALDLRGRGLLLHQGQSFKVPGTLVGESIEYVLEHQDVRPRIRVLSLHERSVHRVAPDCSFAAHCPACTLRHGNADLETALKSERIVISLQRNGLEVPQDVERIWRAERNAYRSRAVARPVLNAGRIELTLVSSEGHIPLSQCPIQSDPCRRVLERLSRSIDQMSITPYDAESRQGELRHVIVDAFDFLPQAPGPTARICLGFGQPLTRDIDWSILRRALPDVAIAHDILPYRSPGLFRAPQAIFGGLAVYLKVADDWLRSTLPAWCPQSPTSLSIVRETVLNWLSPSSGDRVLEVGCGIGTNTLALSRHCHSVLGIDGSRQAIEDAQHNSAQSKAGRIEFRVGWAERALVRIQKHGSFDLSLCHGMREPFGDRSMQALSALRPRKILFLSPSPTALAKDLSALTHYKIQRLGMIDQTPGAPAVLTVALMQRVN